MQRKNINNLIKKKQNKQSLTDKEIDNLINDYIKKNISDEEMQLFLTSLLPNNLTNEEILAMFKSTYQISKLIHFNNVDGFKLDKHSTGGVGDKITLIMLPILTALGIKNFKFSGGRLGHSGGTIEKLNSFPGIKLNLSIKEFIAKSQHESLIIAHTNNEICEFENKLYKLRTLSKTTNITGLITNSIMIKKTLLQNDGLILDIKVGTGSLFNDFNEAEKFGILAKKIAKQYQRKIVIVFSDMNSQLGYTIGNKWEVLEAIEFLKCNYEPKLKELVFYLVYQSLKLKNPELEQNTSDIKVQKVLKNGQALQAFKQFVNNFKGDFDSIANLTTIKTKYQIKVLAWKDGYLKFNNLAKLGKFLNKINVNENNKIDYDVGLVWQKNDGHYFKSGEIIAILYTNQKQSDFISFFKTIIMLEENFKPKKSKILKTI